MILYEEEHHRIVQLCELLRRDSNSRLVFLVDKNGQLIANCGDTEAIDTTSLASLTAGNIAAISGLAKVLGEREFSTLYHKGDSDSIYISIIGLRIILVVVFENRTPLGLVALRVKKYGAELGKIFDEVNKKQKYAYKSPFSEITEADIDKLFSD